MRAFERAQEANGNSRRFGDFSEADAALASQAPQTRTNRGGPAATVRFDGAIAFQHLHNGGGVQAAYLAEIARFLKQTDVVAGVKTVPTLGAVRAGEAQIFPSSNC